MISMQGRAFFQTESAASRFYDAIPVLPPSKWKSIKFPLRRKNLCPIIYKGQLKFAVAWWPDYD